ncbi:MAG: 16S rRNA (guanine(527)-N(7))-methyltransferase RsmG [Bryobacteraceae bacterium]|nr:16S rRNA (guanine(527)-N(7))-methyltransferase RsmG [Bryobacteraceae bacterium]MDW8376996.1 16S rRNA (guanine(527)-N(7))-methyltransferase RsmG [Bryobacterales bacterium]
MSFLSELSQLLPSTTPNREVCILKAARHLELVEAANRHFNLSRISGQREAAIKHVCDSLIPWQLFARASHVVDVGTGAGFPGIPLALALPQVRFTLLESTQKKARFVQSAVAELALTNVCVCAVRAEEWLRSHQAELITARALAPISKAIALFAPFVRAGSRVLLYKGPDAELEIQQAQREAQKRGVQPQIVFRYELPDQAGVRAIVELAAVDRRSQPSPNRPEKLPSPTIAQQNPPRTIRLRVQCCSPASTGLFCVATRCTACTSFR